MLLTLLTFSKARSFCSVGSVIWLSGQRMASPGGRHMNHNKGGQLVTVTVNNYTAYNVGQSVYMYSVTAFEPSNKKNVI